MDRNTPDWTIYFIGTILRLMGFGLLAFKILPKQISEYFIPGGELKTFRIWLVVMSLFIALSLLLSTVLGFCNYYTLKACVGAELMRYVNATIGLSAFITTVVIYLLYQKK